MYDPKAMLTITMNGQMLLLMLCEWLMEVGVVIDMCNTDGITIKYKEEQHNQVEALCKKWMKMSRMELETVTYLKTIRKDINNYLAIYEDKGETKVKLKGMFLIDPDVDMSRDMLIIAKALHARYKDGKDIEEFIRSHDNIYDFCACQKVDKTYDVYWNGVKQQHLNRYYVSNSGPYLYKSKKGSMDHMMKGFSVELFNDYKPMKMSEYNINYEYYITEVKKVIELLEPKQLTIF